MTWTRSWRLAVRAGRSRTSPRRSLSRSGPGPSPTRRTGSRRSAACEPSAPTRDAAERVAALGFPATIVHGDFHPGNVALAGDEAVIIDWSDAAIGNPAIDLVTWLSWSRNEPDEQRVATDAWVDAWLGAPLGPNNPDAVRAAIDDIIVVGAAYQVVSYDGILRALEPATRYTMAGGATSYLKRLEERLGAAT